MAMSVAVVRLAPGNPVTLVNNVRRMPSVRAFAVIRRAEAGFAATQFFGKRYRHVIGRTHRDRPDGFADRQSGTGPQTEP
ncbi:hypothetical protein QP185_15635 [Sphingomonas aerolata]|uniref:hypothetical protein n=1 Tax=Sphingomonas aerolata TaxID=185951 RepID=UPI002FE1345C